MNPRLAAAKALAKVLSGKASLNTSLPEFLERVTPRDRALTQELAYGSARWQPRLNLLAAQWLQKPFKAADRDVEALLLVGLYQLFYTRIPEHAALDETVECTGALKKPWAKGLLNALLRRAQREGQKVLPQLERDPVVRWAHPRWLQKQLKAHWPEHWEAVCLANNAHPPMTLRVNRRHHSQTAYLHLLTEQGLSAQACAYAPEGIQLKEPCDVTQLPGFGEGWVSVQDEAAQCAAHLLELAPHQRILDACCAPGGKTGHILEQSEGLEVVALDLESARLTRVQQNLDRLRLNATLIAADARNTAQWWDGRPFQRILLDAPCSATGVIRRHPDIKLTRNPEDISALAELQGQLLDAVWPTLAVGGLLVYATCSVLPQENTQVIEAFLARTPDAREDSLKALPYGLAQPRGRQLHPQLQGHDGFYYAKLIKIPTDPTPQEPVL